MFNPIQEQEYQEWIHQQNMMDDEDARKKFLHKETGTSVDYTPRKQEETGIDESLFKLNEDPIIPQTSPRKVARLTAEPEMQEVQTVPDAMKEADEIRFEMEEAASVKKFTDDGSLDFVPETPTPIPGPVGHLVQKVQKRIANPDRVDVKPIRLHQDEELDQIISFGPEHPNYDNAWNERLLRSREGRQSFWENVRDPDYRVRKGNKLIGQFEASIPKIPGEIASLAGILATPQGLVLDGLGVPGAMIPAETLIETGAEYNELINELVGINDPEDPAEMAVAIAGGVVPIAPGVKIANPLLKAAEFATPLTVGGGPGRIAANLGVQFVGHEALRPLIMDGNDPYETIFQSFGLVDKAEAEVANPELNFEVGRGPNGEIFRNYDYTKFGFLGIATIAAGLSPSLIKKVWKENPIVTSEFVDPQGFRAPKELQTIEKWQDLYQAYVTSPNEFLRSVLDRNGTNPDGLFSSIETNTGAALHQKVGTAISSGIARTSDGDYLSKIPASRMRSTFEGLDGLKKEQFNMYAAYKDMMDDFAEYGVPILNGMKKSEVVREMNRIARQFPEIKQLHGMYRELRRADLEFAGSGEYAIFSRKKVAELKRTRKNYVPYEIESVDPNLGWRERIARRKAIAGARNASDSETVPFAMRRGPHLEERTRVKASDLFEQATENIVRAKTLNMVRGQIIDALLDNHGQIGHNSQPIRQLAVRVTEKQLHENSQWRDRSITFYRRGVPEHYVLSQGLADIIRFDPNFAKYPKLFGFSRGFQFFTTGYGAPWFAPKHFIRDTIVANVLKEPQTVGFTPLRSVMAIPKQLKAQATKGLSDYIHKQLSSESGAGKVLWEAFGKNDAFMRGVADNLAQSFIDSNYHLFSSHGALNVNMTRNAYKLAHSRLDELLRNDKIPSQVKGLLSVYKNFIDAIQNAPHYAFMEANTGKLTKELGRKLTNRELADLTKMERELTGNITEAGKTYTASGRIIGTNMAGGDLVNKGLMSSIVQDLGVTAQWLREASPWTNAMVAGTRKLGKSYWQNPWTFVGGVWSIYLLPTTLGYFASAMMGEEYLEHMMSRRTEYDKATSIYFPIPGEKPEDGLEIPIALEVGPLKYMFVNQLDYVFRNGGAELGTVSKTIFETFFGLTVLPVATAALGAMGIKGPQTMLEGDAYFVKEDQWSHLPTNLEMAIRGLAASATDVWVESFNAFMEPNDLPDAMMAAVKEAGHQMRKKTPLISKKQLNVAFSEVGEQYQRQRDKLQELERLHQEYNMGMDDFGNPIVEPKPLSGSKYAERAVVSYDDKLIPDTEPNLTKSGTVNKTKPEIAIEEPIIELDPVSNTRWGRAPMPPPTNPIYIALASEIHDMFESKSNNYGVMVTRLGMITDQLQALRRYNEGNLHEFRAYVESMPDTVTINVPEEGDEEVENLDKQRLLEMDLSDRDTIRQAINNWNKERFNTWKQMNTFVQEAQDRLADKLVQQGVMLEEDRDKIDLMKLDPYLDQ